MKKYIFSIIMLLSMTFVNNKINSECPLPVSSTEESPANMIEEIEISSDKNKDENKDEDEDEGMEEEIEVEIEK